jgi:hypothetical protein
LVVISGAALRMLEGLSAKSASLKLGGSGSL